MDMTLLSALTDEEKDRYNRLAQIFAQPGWDDLKILYQNLAQSALLTGANALSWEDNRVALGLRRAYEEFANLDDSVELQYSDLAQENLAMADQEFEDDYE